MSWVHDVWAWWSGQSTIGAISLGVLASWLLAWIAFVLSPLWRWIGRRLIDFGVGMNFIVRLFLLPFQLLRGRVVAWRANETRDRPTSARYLRRAREAPVQPRFGALRVRAARGLTQLRERTGAPTWFLAYAALAVVIFLALIGPLLWDAISLTWGVASQPAVGQSGGASAQAAPNGANLRDWALIERFTLLALVAIASIPLILYRASLAGRQTENQEAGHVTDRIIRATELLGSMKQKSQPAERTEPPPEPSGAEISEAPLAAPATPTKLESLWSPNVEVRLGAIYTLERVARDSPETDHWPIMETLAAYIFENHYPLWKGYDGAGPGEDGETEVHVDWLQKLSKPRADVAAAIRVLLRRGERQWRVEQERGYAHDWSQIPMHGADLRSVFRGRAHKARAQPDSIRGTAYHAGAFQGAKLDDCDLVGARFNFADLRGSKLEFADLRGAYAQHSDFRFSSMAQCRMRFGHFDDSNFEAADLRRADLRRANFDGASFLNASLGKANISILDPRAYKSPFPPMLDFETYGHTEFYPNLISAEQLNTMRADETTKKTSVGRGGPTWTS